MQLHDLQTKTKRKRKKRVGRSGPHGKTSGRGTKGQKARAGHRMRPEMRDTIKKLPKLRGRGKNIFKSFAIPAVPVNVGKLEAAFESGDAVTPAELVRRNMVRGRKGRTPSVKILGTGTLTKKLSVSGCVVSESARAHIEKAGGSVT